MNLLYIIILLFIYSYLGATFEHICYFLNKKKIKILNNIIITGFPLYGLCSLLIIFLSKYYHSNLITQFLVNSSLITIIELIIGLCVDAGKTTNGSIHYWDYSDNFMNYKGIISVRHFVTWGILGITVIYLHNNYIDKFVNNGINSFQ